MSDLRDWFAQAYDRLAAAAGTHVASGTSIIGSREEELAYLTFHRERFFGILRTLAELAPVPSLHVLDIGTSHLTLLLKERYDNVTTLDGQRGWEQRAVPRGIQFLVHDLRKDELPFQRDSFDLIVASEVVEHLPFAPARFLRECHCVLRSRGLLLLTTPNAASYYHRRDMLFGKNPFPMPPGTHDPTGSWHAREYTMRELIGACRASGFQVARAAYPWYWNMPERTDMLAQTKGVLLRFLLSIAPSLRSAMLVVAEKP